VVAHLLLPRPDAGSARVEPLGGDPVDLLPALRDAISRATADQRRVLVLDLSLAAPPDAADTTAAGTGLSPVGTPGDKAADSTGSRTYWVKSGDNLERIASARGVTVPELMRANGIRDANRIAEGQLLRVPPATAGTLGAGAAPTLPQRPTRAEALAALADEVARAPIPVVIRVSRPVTGADGRDLLPLLQVARVVAFADGSADSPKWGAAFRRDSRARVSGLELLPFLFQLIVAAGLLAWLRSGSPPADPAPLLANADAAAAPHAAAAGPQRLRWSLFRRKAGAPPRGLTAPMPPPSPGPQDEDTTNHSDHPPAGGGAPDADVHAPGPEPKVASVQRGAGTTNPSPPRHAAAPPPPVHRAPHGGSGADPHPLAQVLPRERLATVRSLLEPCGYVAIDGGVWRARLAPGEEGPWIDSEVWVRYDPENRELLARPVDPR
jgi:LysM repeat protein